MIPCLMSSLVQACDGMRSLEVGALGPEDSALLEDALSSGQLSDLCSALAGLPGAQRAKGPRTRRLATGALLLLPCVLNLSICLSREMLKANGTCACMSRAMDVDIFPCSHESVLTSLQTRASWQL